MSAIDYQHGAVDVVRRVGTKKHCRVLDIFDQSKPAQRNPLLELFLDRLGYKSFHSFGVADWSRRNRVNANAIAPPLDREISRECIDAGLFETDECSWVVAAMAKDLPGLWQQTDDEGPRTLADIGEAIYHAWGQ